MTPLLVLLLAAPGTLRVKVEGGAAEVRALIDGKVAAVATAEKGVASLSGLEAGAAYDVVALGRAAMSRVERGVRGVADDAPGFDAVLRLRPTHPVAVRTAKGATVHVDGLAFAPDDLRLPAGLHRIVVDHPQRVSGASRLVRVTGPVELDVPLDPGLVVLGQVTHGGEPVAGARVEAYADGIPTGRVATTNGEGAFGLSGFAGNVISLVVRAKSMADTMTRVVFRPGEERARVAVEMPAGSSVALDTSIDAEAILLARWYEHALEEPRLRTNHVPREIRGRRLQFDGLRPGRRYRILVHARGFRPAATAEFVAAAPGKLVLLKELALERAATLAGRVKNGRAGVLVVCRGPEGMQTFRTDRAGRYEFAGLDPGDHFVHLHDVDEQPRKVVVASGRRTTFDFDVPEPDPKRAIRGVVLDAEAKPLAGVVVRAGGRRAVTDEKGAFLLAGLPPGRAGFDVSFVPGPGCRALKDDPHLPETQRRVRVGATLRVLLPAAVTVRLALDTAGYPLSRATLLLASQDGRPMRFRLPRRARAVTLHDVPAGSYSADVAAPGLLGTRGQVIGVKRGDRAPITLRIARGRRVVGRVVLRRILPRDQGEPLIADKPRSPAWVTLLDGAPARAMATAPVDEDGRFVLDGLPLAPVVLCAGAPGLPARAIAVDLTESDGKDVVIALQEGVEAAVVVTGDNERPLPDAYIKILDMIRPDFGVDVRDVAAFGRFRRVVADDLDLGEIEPVFRLVREKSGRVTARFLTPGSYRFDVTVHGYKPAKVGVRARTAWQKEQIEKTLEGVAEVPRDLTPRVPLKRLPGGK